MAAEQVREAYIFYLLTNPHVRLAISRQPAGTNATRTRWFGFKAEVQRLSDDAIVEPRFFPYALRHQLYVANPMCRLCGNEIHSFDDSTVDHIHPYSKGGRTIPENAQLAHRSCNARKCANTSSLETPSVSQLHPVTSTALADTPNPFPSINVEVEPANSQNQMQAGTTLTSASRPNRRPLTLRKKRLNISLYDLIRAGFVKPPFTLEKTFKGRKLLACVEHDGRVTWNNGTYDTLSAAAEAAVAFIMGTARKNPQTNGWDFWQFKDVNGQYYDMAVLRHRYVRSGSD